MSAFALQCRDPFSGDCDLVLAPEERDESLEACSAETRFQGIATLNEAALPGITTVIFLQCRDPFSGDCDLYYDMLFPLAPKNACSAETRFQGIATRSEQQARFCVRANLQCRDPFSGDCDQRWTPLLTGVREILLAVPRPVFRGLRLRGRGAQCAPRPSTCSAETRFQGIATGITFGEIRVGG